MLACSLWFALAFGTVSAAAAPPGPVVNVVAATEPSAEPAALDPLRERLAELLGLTGTRPAITTNPRFLAVEQRELRAPRLLVGFALPAFDIARFEALAAELSTGTAGRLGELVKQRRLASVAARVESLHGTNVLTIELEAAPGCRARELEEALLETLLSLARAPGSETFAVGGSIVEWLRHERRAVIELHPKERYVGSAKPRGPSQHRVERGDTLSEIAERYGLDLETMVKLNQLEPGRPIHPGDRIQLSARRAPLPKLYVVKAGDTLAKVAKRYGVSQKSLLDANRLRDRKVRAGQKLVLPH